MFEKFRPLGDRVLIKRLEGEEKTASGIFIPDAAKEKAQSLARVSGLRLGRIIDVQENGAIRPVMFQEQSMNKVSGEGETTPPTQITPGENTVKVSITLSYETH